MRNSAQLKKNLADYCDMITVGDVIEKKLSPARIVDIFVNAKGFMISSLEAELLRRQVYDYYKQTCTECARETVDWEDLESFVKRGFCRHCWLNEIGGFAWEEQVEEDGE